MLNTLIQKTTLLLCLLSAFMYHSAAAQTGYDIRTGFDVLHSDENTSLRVEVALSYRVTPDLSVGLGTGYTHYDDPLSLLPLFIDLKYGLSRGDTVPFLFLKSGYSFSILTDTDFEVNQHNGGWLFNPGVGIQFATKSGAAFYFNTGYNLNHSKFKNDLFGNRTATTHITYKRLMVGVGLAF